MTKTICDLPLNVVGSEILSKVPITSLGAVRCTCKSWEALTKDWILGKAARQPFVGFMIKDSKLCSLRFQLHKDEDLVDLSIKQVRLLDQVEIFKVFHSDGLLLCAAKDRFSLVVWNPYLGQTRWIRPRRSFHRKDRFAFGYDKNNRNHKILRFLDSFGDTRQEFEIYDLSSSSWRVLDIVTPDFDIESHPSGRGASVKGNTYYIAEEKLVCGKHEEIEDFLICFDFTRERFGPRLPLPVHSYNEETLALSCLREERLALLHYQGEFPFAGLMEIWVTTLIEPKAVSWMRFLKVDTMSLVPVGFFPFDLETGSFFIDEEEKVAVVVHVDSYEPILTDWHNRAFIFGEDGYFESVSLGESNLDWRYIQSLYSYPLVCSSVYLPSLVGASQPSAHKE